MIRGLKQQLRNISISANPEFKAPFIPLTSENGISNAIGNTPLLKLPTISKEIGRNIYAKAEFMNPGGSIKDRAALFIIKDAEAKGLIKPGGTIIEGTAGNTGIGLAHEQKFSQYQQFLMIILIIIIIKLKDMQNN
ncbi:hypothetical protein QCA50_016262 [Cerrena zonata]|uniref:Tryptophan synthase beta chain-like PALP domain-containing protein n=1 Tax=Cerrena zonata TaxID=2478898 RepID=A0AAW0FR41_9APHY